MSSAQPPPDPVGAPRSATDPAAALGAPGAAVSAAGACSAPAERNATTVSGAEPAAVAAALVSPSAEAASGSVAVASQSGRAACGGAGPDLPVAGCSIRGDRLLAWRRALHDASGGARAELDWLLDVGGGLPWARLQSLHLHPEQSVCLALGLEALAELWWRHRREAVPLQYLVGRCPWRHLELRVAPGVLIPRQDTEQLVDLAVQFGSGRSALTWADLGTGSGCLAVALAEALGGSGFAVDASAEALGQAAGNLRQRGLLGRVRLLQSDWWQGLRPWWGQLDLVVANPPYIPSAVLETLDPVVRLHEPRLALDGGPDGLRAIRAILAEAAQALAPGGWLLLEHHHDQSGAVLPLLEEAGLESATAHRDLAGVLRFASARRPPLPARP